MRHGAKVKIKRCCSDGCTNQVVNGGVCRRHGAKVKLCRSEGCTNGAVKGGVCRKHGAKVKLCSHEGCTNQVRKGGVCVRHGANRTPNDVTTAFGTEHDETATPFSVTNHNSNVSHERSAGVPSEVVVQEIVEV